MYWQEVVKAFFIGVAALIIWGLFKYLLRQKDLTNTAALINSKQAKSPASPTRVNASEANKFGSDSTSQIMKDPLN